MIEFIRIVNHPKGLAIGQRHITVSTCGIVPRILEYADEPIRCNLAISLHAANDELRSRIMKINRAYPLKDVIEACRVYFEKTGRRVTFEYILLSGVNDAVEQADELSDRIRGSERLREPDSLQPRQGIRLRAHRHGARDEVLRPARQARDQRRPPEGTGRRHRRRLRSAPDEGGPMRKMKIIPFDGTPE
ncbi:MAG: radical SAM protein [Bacillus subtilis]|nr:radical SAM protein [Bacillus subtilis]